jgi:hypothetical protein
MFDPEEEPEEFEIYDEEENYDEDCYGYDYDNGAFSGSDYYDPYRDLGEPDHIYDYSHYGDGDN